MNPPVKTWKVTPSEEGVLLTINGQTFNLSHSAHAITFDLQQALLQRAMEKTQKHG